MKPLFLAPMAGITDKPFRQMVRKFGNHTLFTEMVGVESLLRSHPVTQKMMQVADEDNLIVQLVGPDAEHLAQAAKIAEDMGIQAIDINMGCPVKKLISNYSGAKLMLEPERAADIVNAVTNAVNIPVSVKMRLGWDEKRENAVEFARLMVQSGAKRLTVHGRTKDQGYSGYADWHKIAEVKQAVSVPVIANGDIVDRQTAVQAENITGADGLMIGRGALGKPWILAEIETGQRPTFNLSDLVLEHLDLMLDYYGLHGLKVARKHIAWYAKGKKGLAHFCQSVYAEQDLKTVKRMIKTFFEGEE